MDGVRKGGNMEKIRQLREWIAESENVVFFGGAGVSTESNIPDFRGVDGLYHEQYKYPPETIISHSFYVKNPGEFYHFYRNKMIFPDAEPNKAHLALAKLEDMGPSGAGAPRLCEKELLHQMRKILRPRGDDGSHGA